MRPPITLGVVVWNAGTLCHGFTEWLLNLDGVPALTTGDLYCTCYLECDLNELVDLAGESSTLSPRGHVVLADQLFRLAKCVF